MTWSTFYSRLSQHRNTTRLFRVLGSAAVQLELFQLLCDSPDIVNNFVT